MGLIKTCIDCGSNHWTVTGGKRHCAKCGSDRVRDVVAAPRKEATQSDIGYQILDIVKDAIKCCATYDASINTIRLDHKRIKAIIDNATEVLRLIQDITNG